jgi:hypothetical protein
MKNDVNVPSKIKTQKILSNVMKVTSHGYATLQWQENISNTTKHKLHTGIPYGLFWAQNLAFYYEPSGSSPLFITSAKAEKSS